MRPLEHNYPNKKKDSFTRERLGLWEKEGETEGGTEGGSERERERGGREREGERRERGGRERD